MNKMKVVPFIIVIALMLLSVFYFDYFRFSGSDKSAIIGSGTIEVTEINISSQISGRIVKLPKNEGDVVNTGDLVAQLETNELDAQKNSAWATLHNAEISYKRANDLYKTGSLSKREYDNALTSLKIAKANLNRIEATIKYASVHSFINGTVLERNMEISETAFPGSSLITIADLSKPWIYIYIAEPYLGHVRIGQKANVYIDSHPKRAFPGKIIAISNKAEFTPKTIQTKDERVKLMYGVKISLENRDLILKPGMPADAEIIREN